MTPRDALASILPAVGWPTTLSDNVAFPGGVDPILPTPYRIGVAGAATLGATGLAVEDLWALRTGRRQSISVDVRQATASLRSGHYMKLGDGEVSARRNSIMGVYPTKDGRWSYLHCNFPNHRAAALSVLGVPEDRDAVAKAVLNWNAQDLEEAIIAMETSSLVREALGADVFEYVLRNKRAECADYCRQVSAYELNRYLPVL